MRTFLKHIPGFRSNKNWKKIIACMYYLISILGNTNDLGGLLFMLSFPFFIFGLIDLFKASIKKEPHKRAALTTFIALLAFIIGINNLGTADTNSNLAAKTNDELVVEEVAEDEDVNVAVQDEETQEEAQTQILNLETATVTQHVDGDTVYVRLENGQEYKLRMIGVDTPETVHPSKPIEFYGKEASNFTKSKLLGKTVYLEKDVSETDRYGRLLRYVWLEPPTEINKAEIKSKMFNAILVANGYAQVATYPPDVKYQDYFLEFEREARSKNIGLWGKPDEPTSAAKSGSGSTTSNSSGSKSTSTSSNTSSKSGSSNTSTGSSGSGQNSFPDRSEPNKAYKYMGNSNSMKFHLTTCTYAKKTSESNRVYFNSRDEAIKQGYVPCKVCNP